MFTQLLFVLCLLNLVNLVDCADIPLFTPLNLNVSETGYIINGTAFVELAYYVPIILPNSSTTVVMDPLNNRMALHLGPGGGGTWVINATHAFVFNQAGDSSCKLINGWNYSQQVAGWARALSLDGSKTSKAIYASFVEDAGGCGHRVTATVQMRDDIIISLNYAQGVPIAAIDPDFCFDVNSRVVLDKDTLSRTGDKSPYFVVPEDCDDPEDFCESLYPDANPCDPASRRRYIAETEYNLRRITFAGLP